MKHNLSTSNLILNAKDEIEATKAEEALRKLLTVIDAATIIKMQAAIAKNDTFGMIAIANKILTKK